MKKGFYLKLAWINIQKNHRFFLPRILSETGLLACFYIALTLTMDDRIKEARGGYLIAPLMSIGLVVLVLLSTVLMLYINSFLMKQRTREFGVYNVLGMEKRHIGKVLFRENEISSLISVVSGLVLGIIFYKLCSLLICRLLQSDILLGFYYIRPLTLILSGGFFVVLDLFAFAVNRIRIARMKPVELLKSMNAGEKEPKVKWLIGQLKDYLKRLGDGEQLDTVRADFVEKFSDVEAAEIMKAEQELMKEGTPLAEVQKLCDIHSALFHGSTREEKIMNAELEVGASLKRQAEAKEAAAKQEEAKPTDRKEMANVLLKIKGHPLETFTRENEALEEMLPEIYEMIGNKTVTPQIVEKLRQIAIHYAKKGDLLYPHLKVKYDVTGPSEVMWTVDDEIRDELGKLAKLASFDKDWYSRFEKVLTRAEEMIYKEKNILFPICAEYFSAEEWYSVYEDAKDYAPVFGVEPETWNEAEAYGEEKKKKSQEALMNGEIVMPGGHMTVEQLTALLNTIPLEISFIDENNINRYFNEGPKVFKRAGMAIDREVFSCHPPKIEPMVRAILDSFRDGSRDSVPVWMEKNGRTMLVTYMAVRDRSKHYLGTVELVQDMEFAKEHFSK